MVVQAANVIVLVVNIVFILAYLICLMYGDDISSHPQTVASPPLFGGHSHVCTSNGRYES